MKRSLLILPAVILLAPLQTFGQVTIPYTSEVLQNGLTVVLHEDHSVPVVSVNVWYHVGSGREKPGRTGFAHLFEHMLFQGSEHVGDDQHFGYIQESGGTLNGSTNNDRTNYYETVPSQFLEMALWLESDRMGFLLPAMTQEKLDNQRDVVKNERRQRTDNQPYGRAFERIQALLYPEGHPYSWPVIGSMDDLSAASLEDVSEFFRTYYVPNNASLVIVGDFDPEQTMTWVKKYFGPIPAGEVISPMGEVTASLATGKRDMMEDRVQLPRLYIAWHSPAMATQDDAVFDVLSDILAGGKSSRLYKSLVYDQQIAQDVSAFQFSRKLSGALIVQVTAKPDVPLSQIEQEVRKEISRLATEPPSSREIERARNSIRAGFIYGLQSTAGKADRMNGYQFFWDDPGAIGKDLARFEKVTPKDVQNAVRQYVNDGRVIFSVVPEGRTDLAAE